jgi:RimJ/RimL family protein N-acetyltransferase/enterochelin esterase-like enzyme
MDFINPPEKSPQNITHKTFYSQLYNHEIGYNIYLPDGYEKSSEKYPVAYHLHGWTGSESSEIWQMEKVYSNKRAITVFPNSSPVIEDFENLPVERMIIDEFIPYIDTHYRTNAMREGRTISGFSMGGAAAFCWAAKYSELFSSVTAYAGTYHHYYHKGSQTVGQPPEKAAELYNSMMNEKRYLEAGNVLCLIRQNAEKIRGVLDIRLHIGTDDVLFCDNEILHLYLDSLCIPHEYKKFYGIAHELDKIVLKEQDIKGKPAMLKHKGTVTIETERLILRRFQKDDLEQIYHNCWSDPEIWKWTRYEPMDSIDDVIVLNNIFTDFWFSKYERLDNYDWALRHKASGEVIGRLRGINSNNRRDKTSQIELAYELGQSWWNQGLMTEAVKAVVGFFFNDVGFSRVYAYHAHGNPASGRVMQKCGMVYEGTARQMCLCNCGMFDAVSYAILADDYIKTHNGGNK